MDKTEGVIAELLPMAQEGEMRAFLQEQAAQNAAFSVKLSQWLMRKYGVYTNGPSVYVEEVERLFGVTEEKYRGYNRWRYYDDCGLNWSAIDSGMEMIAATLREKLAAGEYAVVVPPVVTFYRLSGRHVDEFMEEEEPSLNSAAQACDSLLLAWAEHPEVPLNEKREVYQTLQSLAKNEIMEYVDGLSDSFFMNFLTRMLSPQEALVHIEKLVAEGNKSESLALRHISLLRQFGRDAEALHVIRQNLRYRSVLDAELDRLYALGDDAGALELLERAYVGKGTDSALEERKLRFLERAGHTEKLIESYRYLLIHQWNPIEYLHKIKALVADSEWPTQYRLIVEDGIAAGRSEEFMACIYAEEYDIPALYQVVASIRYNILNALLEYMPLLPVEYHQKLLKKGYNSIEKEAHRANKRSEYAEVASKIRRFATLPGAKSMAESMVAMLRETYFRRPAYIDELSKVELK